MSVSIPQAVSAVATWWFCREYGVPSFNTASGKCCCNYMMMIPLLRKAPVSIPQAVSAVATAGSRKPVFKRFQKVVLETLKP